MQKSLIVLIAICFASTIAKDCFLGCYTQDFLTCTNENSGDQTGICGCYEKYGNCLKKGSGAQCGQLKGNFQGQCQSVGCHLEDCTDCTVNCDRFAGGSSSTPSDSDDEKNSGNKKGSKTDDEKSKCYNYYKDIHFNAVIWDIVTGSSETSASVLSTYESDFLPEVSDMKGYISWMGINLDSFNRVMLATLFQDDSQSNDAYEASANFQMNSTLKDQLVENSEYNGYISYSSSTACGTDISTLFQGSSLSFISVEDSKKRDSHTVDDFNDNFRAEAVEMSGFEFLFALNDDNDNAVFVAGFSSSSERDAYATSATDYIATVNSNTISSSSGTSEVVDGGKKGKKGAAGKTTTLSVIVSVLAFFIVALF